MTQLLPAANHLQQEGLCPLTAGIGRWAQRARSSGNAGLFPMAVVGGLVTIVPLTWLFLLPQRYWRSGLPLGSIAGRAGGADRAGGRRRHCHTHWALDIE